MRQISILILFLTAFSVFGQDYFASNSSGMLFEKINHAQLGQHEWYARVDATENQIVKVLYDSVGNEAKRWDTFKEGGTVVKEVMSSGSQRTEYIYESYKLSEEISYFDDKITGRVSYKYDGNFLKEIIEQNAEGKKIGSISIKRDDKNRISSADFSYGENKYTNRFIFSRGRLIMEWHGTDSKNGNSVRYDQDGKLLNTTRWENGKKVGEEKFEYKDGVLSNSVAVAKSGGEKDSKKYDASGNIVYQEEIVDGNLVRKEFYTYDESSNLIEKRVVRDGLVEKSRYLYSNGDLEQELLYKNGILTKIFTYVTKENYTEDVYSDNMPILRHYYINHRKVSREEWESQVVGG